MDLIRRLGFQQKKVKEALRGIHNYSQWTFPYTKESVTEQLSPYILPVENHENQLYGAFFIDGKWKFEPIGFEHKDSLFTKYYARTPQGIVEVKYDPAFLFLPLKVLPHIVTFEGDTAKHPLFGINGTQGKLPLMLLTENDSGIRAESLHKTGEKIAYHWKSNSQEQLRPLLETLYNGAQTPAKTTTPATTITEKTGEIDWKEPVSIVQYTDRFVVGQEQAKKTVAVAFSTYMEYTKTEDASLPKDNVIVIGRTGTGKTLLSRTLAKKADVPFLHINMTSKSTEGYKGGKIKSAFAQLKGEAPYAVVFLDEVDKIATQGDTNSYAKGLQDELIGIVENGEISLGDGYEASDRMSTSNMLFIAAGAFEALPGRASLESIIAKRLKKETPIGFQAEREQQSELIDDVTSEDLINYGLKPEFVGRFPLITRMLPLTIEDKIQILTIPEDSIMRKYTKLFAAKGFELEINPAVYRIIADKAPSDTGARGLNGVVSKIFTELLYDPQYHAKGKRIELDVAKAEDLLTRRQGLSSAATITEC